jgi:8-oxo-dGTP pyrophosphatase MutT (NUDIX family)
MTKKADIHKAGGVLIKDRHFLVTRAKGKDIFVAPGGKLEDGETAVGALAREMIEELQLDIRDTDIVPLGTYSAQAAGNESKSLEMDVFLIGDVNGEPIPSSEIEEIMWVNTKTKGVNLGSIFEHDVMPKIKAMDLID